MRKTSIGTVVRVKLKRRPGQVTRLPGILADDGALGVRRRAILPEMMVAAAEVIAAPAGGGAVVPSSLNLEVHQEVRRAVAAKARSLGLAGTEIARPTTDTA